jgi:hypothetical protein
MSARPVSPLLWHPWRCLHAGVPLTLLIDLAAGDALDSSGILAAEQVATLVASAWAELGHAGAAGSAWAQARGA